MKRQRITQIFSLFFLFCTTHFCAQINREITPPDYIKTVIFDTGQEFVNVPYLELGNSFSLTFDDIIGDEADYYYKIRHFNFDWTPSILTKNEYMEGFDNIRIFDYENSVNALQIYSHYRLRIPNSDTKRLKVSGNYMIEIYNDKEELVFSKKFVMYEKQATVKVAIKRSRDLKSINYKQLVQFSISASDLLFIEPKKNVKTLVFQNYDFRRPILDLVPQYTVGNELIYRYNEEASFWGGNEFLFFDNKDIRIANNRVSRIELNKLYNHYLFTDITRQGRPYTFYPDVNGNFVVRNIRANRNDIEAEYVKMHFSLDHTEDIGDAEIHIYGNYNSYILDDHTRMQYNERSGIYENELMLKQGFYNYRYVLRYPDGTLDPGAISGNFDETENEYTVIPFYRGPGDRYDRAIGIGTGNSRNITN